MSIKFTISGLRGVWGDNLTEEITRTYLEAFAVFLQKKNAKKVILGRDTRASGPIIAAIAKEIFVSAGFEVIDIGIAPTPTLIYTLRNEKLDGGIILTASHNPPEYNGIKFFSSRAMYINQSEIDEVASYLGSSPKKKEGGKITDDPALGLNHIAHIIKNVDQQKIAEKKLKVVIDTINGAGCELGPKLLRDLGCEVTVINGTPDGDFAHMPEPLKENLSGLAEKVKEVAADIGFALDPDADRLVICDERGEITLEEYMLSICTKAVLEKTPGDIATNLSTSNTTEDLALSIGHKNFRTKVGEGNVVEGIIAHSAVIGGEGSGGVIYPLINLCRDGLTGMALILDYLAHHDQSVSEIVASLPQYVFVKTKEPFSGSIVEILAKVITLFPEGTIDQQDGLRIDFSDRSWVQIRESNTEPIIRIWSEAKEKTRAENLVNQVKSLLD